jgi:arabinogalactan endo-1,4-beta-galactosidase
LISSVLFTITGTDAGSNTGTTTLTLTVTQGNSTVSVDGPTKVIYRTTSNETATVSALGKVTFYWNGKKIPGCQSLQASGSPTYTAVCQWKPALIGRGNLLAKLTPSTTAITGSSSSNFAVDVARRTSTR